MNPAMVEGIVPADVSYVSELSETEIEERRWSTLDLCACDAMTIFLSKSPMSAQRVQKIKDLLSRDTNLCPISKNRTLIRFVVFGADVDVVPSSTSTSFLEGARLTEALDGGVLVNPDQHILSVISKETSAEEVVAEVKRYYFRDSPS